MVIKLPNCMAIRFYFNFHFFSIAFAKRMQTFIYFKKVPTKLKFCSSRTSRLLFYLVFLELIFYDYSKLADLTAEILSRTKVGKFSFSRQAYKSLSKKSVIYFFTHTCNSSFGSRNLFQHL